MRFCRSTLTKALVLLAIASWVVNAGGAPTHGADETAVATPGNSLMLGAFRSKHTSPQLCLLRASSEMVNARTEFRPRSIVEDRSARAFAALQLKSVKLQV